jgi:D-3-phosphoglycerate dehydrogenase
LIIRSGIQIDAEMFAAAPRLKAIARAGVGVDNVDLSEATRRGVVVMNTPGGNSISTAEHTLGLMLALARHTVPAHISLAEGRWDRKAFTGVELRGKTLGIVGLGRVGQAVARLALAFQMTVVACDPYVQENVAAGLGVEMVNLDTLYARADFITLHCVSTDETHCLINRHSLAAMKPGVRIVNAARGALFAAEDVADALRGGHVAGVAIDVYEHEPPGPDHPLIGLPGVIHTPHLGASTTDAQVAVAVDAAQQIVDALLKGEYRNVVNPEVHSR